MLRTPMGDAKPSHGPNPGRSTLPLGQTLGSVPVVLACVPAESGLFGVVAQGLRADGSAVEVLTGLAEHAESLRESITRLQGRGVYVICGSADILRVHAGPLREVLRTCGVPYGRTLCVDSVVGARAAQARIYAAVQRGQHAGGRTSFATEETQVQSSHRPSPPVQTAPVVPAAVMPGTPEETDAQPTAPVVSVTPVPRTQSEEKPTMRHDPLPAQLQAATASVLTGHTVVAPLPERQSSDTVSLEAAEDHSVEEDTELDSFRASAASRRRWGMAAAGAAAVALLVGGAVVVSLIRADRDVASADAADAMLEASAVAAAPNANNRAADVDDAEGAPAPQEQSTRDASASSKTAKSPLPDFNASSAAEPNKKPSPVVRSQVDSALTDLQPLPDDAPELDAAIAEALQTRELRAWNAFLLPAADAAAMAYADAVRYCQELRVREVSGFRLASVGELYSLARAKLLQRTLYWSETPGDAFGDVMLVFNPRKRRAIPLRIGRARAKPMCVRVRH